MMMHDFIECDTCRSKPGSPVLCAGCLHNRTVIAALREQQDAAINISNMAVTARRQAYAALRAVYNAACHHPQCQRALYDSSHLCSCGLSAALEQARQLLNLPHSEVEGV